MAEFIFAYRQPAGYQQRNADTAAAWQSWLASLGPALRDMGKPVFDRATVGTTGGDGTKLGGYSVVTAEGLDDALAMAKDCPVVAIGGGVEVGTLAEIPSDVSAS